MAQYCRYCSSMICGDANYCRERNVTMSKSQLKRSNICSHFALNPIDALSENEEGYKPREPKYDIPFPTQLAFESEVKP